MFKIKACLLYLVAGLLVAGCTDLATTVEDAIGEDVSGGSTPPIADPAAALTGVYNQLRTMRGVTNTFALMEHTTDEMMGPTRGTDWSDFGVWRQLHAHTWFFFFQAEDGIRDYKVTGVQTCALPISRRFSAPARSRTTPRRAARMEPGTSTALTGRAKAERFSFTTAPPFTTAA